MPHFVIEYSANLDGQVDFGALCQRVHQTIVDTGLFELGAIRVRCHRAGIYAITDYDPRNAFIDMSFRVGVGRSQQDKQRTGEAIFEAVAAEVATLFDSQHFALSLEIREIDPQLSWKRNSMHARLRAPADS